MFIVLGKGIYFLCTELVLGVLILDGPIWYLSFWSQSCLACLGGEFRTGGYWICIENLRIIWTSQLSLMLLTNCYSWTSDLYVCLKNTCIENLRIIWTSQLSLMLLTNCYSWTSDLYFCLKNTCIENLRIISTSQLSLMLLTNWVLYPF